MLADSLKYIMKSVNLINQEKWKPFNVMIFVQSQTDNINHTITRAAKLCKELLGTFIRLIT